MAEYYANQSAVGGGVGSQPDPFTFAEAVVFINAGAFANGDRMNLQNSGGVFLTADFSITSNAVQNRRRTFEGCTAVAGDGGIATIQRSGGAGHLFTGNAVYWLHKNLIIDGQNAGGYCVTTNTAVQWENIEIKNAGSTGIYNGRTVNCYAHDCGGHGFQGGVANFCRSEDNATYGFYNMDCNFCISKGNTTYNFYCYSGTYLHCISDGGAGDGFLMQYAAEVINCIAINAPAGKYGVHFISSTADRGAQLVKNIGFYNNDTDSNRPTYIDTYYTIDPQFTNPAIFDYTRTGLNLDDKGFSEVGMTAPNYGVDIGVDQRRTCTLPVIGEVEKGVAFVDHGDAKVGTLEAVTLVLPLDVVVEDEQLVVEVGV